MEQKVWLLRLQTRHWRLLLPRSLLLLLPEHFYQATSTCTGPRSGSTWKTTSSGCCLYGGCSGSGSGSRSRSEEAADVHRCRGRLGQEARAAGEVARRHSARRGGGGGACRTTTTTAAHELEGAASCAVARLGLISRRDLEAGFILVREV